MKNNVNRFILKLGNVKKTLGLHVYGLHISKRKVLWGHRLIGRVTSSNLAHGLGCNYSKGDFLSGMCPYIPCFLEAPKLCRINHLSKLESIIQHSSWLQQSMCDPYMPVNCLLFKSIKIATKVFVLVCKLWISLSAWQLDCDWFSQVDRELYLGIRALIFRYVRESHKPIKAIQSYLFNMTRLGNEKEVVLSRCHIFNNMTNGTWLSQ